METEGGAEDTKTLFILGGVGSILTNIAIAIMISFTFYRWVFPDAEPGLMFIIAIVSALVFVIGCTIEAFGYYGIYRTYRSWMGMVSLIFTILTAILLSICTALPVIQPVVYENTMWFWVNWQTFEIISFYWIGLAILGMTSMLQGLTFLLTRKETGLSELSMLNGILLMAAGAFFLSYFGTIIGMILMFTSRVLSVIMFLRAKLS